MPANPQTSLFAQALDLHRQGRLDPAASRYQAALAADPGHAETLMHLGVLRLQQGRPGDAEALLLRAEHSDPASAAIKSNLGAALQAQGRLAEAIAAHQTAVAAGPAFPDALHGLAAALQADRRPEAALACYEKLLILTPDQPEAHYGAAAALQAAGRLEEAAGHYRRAIALDPDFAEANYGLALILQQQNRHAEAIACFTQALDVDPDYAEAQHGIAISLLTETDYQAAAAHLQRAAALTPDNPDPLRLHGETLMRLEHYQAAETVFRRYVKLVPNAVAPLLALAGALGAQKREAEALPSLELALSLDPGAPKVMALLGTALLAVERQAEALPLLEQAAAAQPDLALAWNGLGMAREQLGDLGGAGQAFREAVRLAPELPGHYHGLFNCAKVQPGEPVLAALEAMDAGKLSVNDQTARLFALGKACDDLGEKARGFDCLLAGNCLKRTGVEYDETATLTALANLGRRYTPELIRAFSGQGAPEPAPIFILGMPRSGSTLVEQILVSHPKVLAGGERRDFGEAVSGAVQDRAAGERGKPDLFLSFENGGLRRLGRAYLDLLPELPAGKHFITDKMPSNFAYAGLIHLALPNARIIHTRRDPVDTCLSCFSKLFNGSLNYTYDLGELGRYYHAYTQVMAHWRQVLPDGVILDVDYEDVVADLEGQARRLLAFCGLPWDDACLAFHETKRAVRTASVAQVRQPIYASSVGKWRPEAGLLQPLLDGIAGK